MKFNFILTAFNWLQILTYSHIENVFTVSLSRFDNVITAVLH